MRTIAIINQKGGCGKTTTAINLAAVLAEAGHRTLLVDLDPQSHCAAGLAVPPASIEYDIGDAMLKANGQGFDPARLLWRVSKNLDLAPSRTKLAALEATRGGLASAPEREHRLRKVLDQVLEASRSGGADVEAFEFAVIDCPPSIGLLTYNAITAADEIIIPVETSFFSLQGATKQVATIQSLSKRLGNKPATRLLATIHDPTHSLAQDLREELVKRFKSAVIPVTIRLDRLVREAASFGQPIIEYAEDSTGTADYRALGSWVCGSERDGSLETQAADPTTIEVKTTELPLGARRRTAKPLNPIRPAPSRASERETAAKGSAVAVATAVQTETIDPSRSEPKPAEPIETISRVEDLCRRAQALNDKIKGSPSRTQTRLRSSTGAVRLIEETHDKDRRAKSVSRLFGVRRHGDRFIFVQPIELGIDVRIAGDFNGWNPNTTPMKRSESLGVHEATIDAPASRTRYRLVVDGRWVDDQFNPIKEHNEFGDLNSIIEAG